MRRILDKLDARAEAQTFLPGAHYHAGMIDTYHDIAGALEQRWPEHVNPPASILAPILRRLRKLLAAHKEVCR
jgi:hypothetical protein